MIHNKLTELGGGYLCTYYGVGRVCDEGLGMKLREEGPTLALLVLTYGLFFQLPLSVDFLPLVAIIPSLTIVIVMHSSLQHEVLHGHPFANQSLNDALVFPAIGLLVPYIRFKDTHLAHHFDPNLTDPYDDPETNFIEHSRWSRMPFLLRVLAEFNNTLFGRMLIGPAFSLLVFYGRDVRSILKGDRRILWAYIAHLMAVALPLFWVISQTALPLWAYVLSAYFAMSLLKIRTYLEHQAHERSAARSVIIEDRGLLSLLFLNNNYHAVHHAYPKVIWHKLPQVFANRREAFLRHNDGYTYASYREIFLLYFFKRKDPVVHPLWTLENRENRK